MDRAFFAIFMSLFIHFVLSWLIVNAPIPVSNKNETIVVEVLPPQKSKSQFETMPLVRQALIPDKLKVQESEDPLRFWSKETVRVKEQTQAAKSGLTQNSSAQATARQQQKSDKKHLTDSSSKITDNSLAESENFFPKAIGQSTIGEALPQEVKVGSFTALNTDRHLFYSFYARVEEKIRGTWEDQVYKTMRQTPAEKLQANVRSRWVTHLEVLVKPNGRLAKILTMKESGLTGFDQSAIQAFIQADYFPNPPKEMIQEDGFIHMKYSFTVHTDPRSVASP